MNPIVFCKFNDLIPIKIKNKYVLGERRILSESGKTYLIRF